MPKAFMSREMAFIILEILNMLWCSITDPRKGIKTTYYPYYWATHLMFSRKKKTKFSNFTNCLTNHNTSSFVCFSWKRSDWLKDSWIFGILFSWKHVVSSSYVITNWLPKITSTRDIFYFRSSSNNEETLISNRISRATKAIDNSIGPKATGHFLAMPSVLNRYELIYTSCSPDHTTDSEFHEFFNESKSW